MLVARRKYSSLGSVRDSGLTCMKLRAKSVTLQGEVWCGYLTSGVAAKSLTDVWVCVGLGTKPHSIGLDGSYSRSCPRHQCRRLRWSYKFNYLYSLFFFFKKKKQNQYSPIVPGTWPQPGLSQCVRDIRMLCIVCLSLEFQINLCFLLAETLTGIWHFQRRQSHRHWGPHRSLPAAEQLTPYIQS